MHRFSFALWTAFAVARTAHADCALHEAKLPIMKDAEADEEVLGDFNGDGKLDVAIAESVGHSDSRYKPAGDVRVFLGNGDGTFGKPIVSKMPAPESWRATGIAGDFDGDGKLDLFFGNASQPSHAKQSWVLLPGKGNGSFGAPVVGTNNGYGFYNVRAADIDGDKKSDVIATVQYDSAPPAISILQGARKPGKMTPFKKTTKSDLPMELAYDGKFTWEVADLDHDGAPELIAAPDGLAAVDFFRDTGAGNYGVCGVTLSKKLTIGKPQCTESKEEWGPETVAIADFNGDGKLDVVSAPEQHSYMSEGHRLDLVMTTARGAFEKRPRPIQAATTSLNVFMALDARDVTADGKPDIIAVGTKSGGSDLIALVLEGNGDGTFTKSSIATTNFAINGNASVTRFGQFQGAGTLGFTMYAWEGPETFVHVYSGRCK